MSGDVGARLVADRAARYGPPDVNWRRAARFWSIILEAKLSAPIEPRDVGLMMLGWKLARLCAAPDDADSLDDIAGYAHAMRLLDAD